MTQVKTEFDKGYEFGVKESADRIAELEKEKTLTDEEIIELFSDTRFDAEERIQFARAILKKASEK